MTIRSRLLRGLVAAISMVPATAIASPVPAQAADNILSDRGCKVTALTDVVDRTNKVSGGGSVYCPPPNDPANPFAITVTLFRDGDRVAADANVCSPPALGCYAAVDINDTSDGKQKWQVKVLVQGSYGGVQGVTKSGNILLH